MITFYLRNYDKLHKHNLWRAMTDLSNRLNPRKKRKREKNQQPPTCLHFTEIVIYSIFYALKIHENTLKFHKSGKFDNNLPT